jgi:AmmeMemoRadiSam system protein A
MTTPQSVLPQSARKELLTLARDTLERYLHSGETLPYQPGEPEVCSRFGAFVSLHRGRELRGCIGQLTADRDLWRTVQHCAISAASEDSRFSPVEKEELSSLVIEISVLTPLRPAAHPDDIEVGRHGLLIAKGERRGLLLPQVARQYGWDRETFLAQTCRKAGLAEDCWREPATEIHIFEAEVFSEDLTTA